MAYRERIDPVALGQIEQFAAWLSDYNEDFAIDQIERLDEVLRVNLGETALIWSYSRRWARHIAGISFASVVEHSTGSFTPSTKQRAS
jgi:hypothetical protein